MVVRREVGGYVRVSDGRIYFEKTGAGPAVLMFHPLGTSTWAWSEVMEPMGQHFTCYAFDMLGHARSDKPSRQFTMPDFAASMDEAMDSLGIERAHVVGNSVGSILAAEFAASFPDRVDRLLLVGVPMWDPRTAPQRLQEAAPQYDANALPVPRTREQLIEATTFGRNPKQEWVDKNNELRSQAGAWVLKTVEALSWYDVVPRLPLIKANATMVLYGELDRLRDGEDLLLNNLRNATRVILPGLGHVPQIEGPEAFVSAVTPFLQGS